MPPGQDPPRPTSATTSAQRRDLRREELLDAADTVVRRVGNRVSAALIAEEAGITKPIIYRHFDDISDLFRALAARHEERLTNYMRAARERDRHLDRRGRMRNVIDAFFEAIHREPNLYRFLVHNGSDAPDQGAPLSWFTRQFAADIGRHLGREIGKPDSAEGAALGLAMAGALNAVGSWWLEQESVPKELMVETITDFLVSGIPPAPPEVETPIPIDL